MSENKPELTTLENFTFSLDNSEETCEIRIHLDEDGQPWFVVKDIAEALELQGHSNTTTLVERVPEAFQDYLTLGNIPNASGIVRDTYMAAEPACYYLILTSRAEKAFPMCRWVCEEVLPSIRQTGSYTVVGDENSVPDSFKELQRTVHTYQQEVAEGMFEAVKRIRKDNADLKGSVDHLTNTTGDLRQTIANNDKAIIDNQQHLIGGQKSLWDMIQEQAVPIVQQPVKRKYIRKEYPYTSEEMDYFKFLNEKLCEGMSMAKQQVSAHVNTSWRRKYGYKIESNEEHETKGTNLLGIVAKEHQLEIKYPDNDLTKRLGISTDEVRPHHRELFKLMEDEISMETGEHCSIEKFVEPQEVEAEEPVSLFD